MTPKQEAFAREYLVDLNATQAAIRAGYSPKTANRAGPRLLSNVGVAAYIEKNASKRAEKLELTAEMVLRELMNLAFNDPSAAFSDSGVILDPRQLPEPLRRAIAGFDVDADGKMKVRFHSKPQALDLLGKHLKLFTERREVEHTGEVTFNMVLQDAKEKE